MGDQFVISEDMILKAKTYIPLAEKVAFAKVTAPLCLETVEISTMKVQSDATLALPEMVEENPLIKQLYLMEFFLAKYFGIKIEGDFNSKAYDHYARSHPLNQLERFKGTGISKDKEVRDRVFDILSDFKEVKKYLEVEIYNLRMSRNDSLERFLAGITVLSDPETIKALTEELKKSGTKLGDMVQKKEKKEKPPEVS